MIGRSILIAIAALALTSCGGEPEDIIFESTTAKAALKLEGFSKPVLQSPEFVCDPNIKDPSPFLGNFRGLGFQNGTFFRALKDGKKVTGAICYGAGKPAIIKITGYPQ